MKFLLATILLLACTACCRPPISSGCIESIPFTSDRDYYGTVAP